MEIRFLIVSTPIAANISKTCYRVSGKINAVFLFDAMFARHTACY
jgi:hypothetical protein